MTHNDYIKYTIYRMQPSAQYMPILHENILQEKFFGLLPDAYSYRKFGAPGAGIDFDKVTNQAVGGNSEGILHPMPSHFEVLKDVIKNSSIGKYRGWDDASVAARQAEEEALKSPWTRFKRWSHMEAAPDLRSPRQKAIDAKKAQQDAPDVKKAQQEVPDARIVQQEVPDTKIVPQEAPDVTSSGGIIGWTKGKAGSMVNYGKGLYHRMTDKPTEVEAPVTAPVDPTVAAPVTPAQPPVTPEAQVAPTPAPTPAPAPTTPVTPTSTPTPKVNQIKEVGTTTVLGMPAKVIETELNGPTLDKIVEDKLEDKPSLLKRMANSTTEFNEKYFRYGNKEAAGLGGALVVSLGTLAGAGKIGEKFSGADEIERENMENIRAKLLARITDPNITVQQRETLLSPEFFSPEEIEQYRNMPALNPSKWDEFTTYMQNTPAAQVTGAALAAAGLAGIYYLYKKFTEKRDIGVEDVKIANSIDKQQ